MRITVVHQAALGDTILLLPLFAALRERAKSLAEPCAITLVCKTNFGQMLTMLGFIEAYASADDRDHTAWFRAPDGNAPNSVPEWAGADLLLSAVSTGADAWAANARLARASLRISGANDSAHGGGLLFFEGRAPPGYRAHVTQWHREQLKELDLREPASVLPRVNPDGAVLIHPGSGGEAKCWPREKYLSLGRTLKRLGIMPTFVLGEVEQDKWGQQVINGLKEEFPWYLHMGLYEVAERIARARFFVGNDAGVTHVAAAMGIPVLALFGPSDDVQWRPVGPEVKVLRAAPPHERSLEALEESVVLGEVLAELRKI